MRVTFLLPRYGWRPSGGFSVVYTYAGLLVDRGHEVHVVHPRRLPAGGWPEPATRFARVRHRAGRVRDRLLRPSLRWAQPDPRVHMRYVPDLTEAHVPAADAVIATWWSTAETALRLPDSRGERYHLIQGYEVWGGTPERVHAAWRAPLRKIVISGWLFRRAMEIGVPESMMTVIHNAVAHDVFRLLQPIEDRPPSVAMLYSSPSYKGGDIGIEMLRRVKVRVPDLRATLFGVEAAPRGLPDWVTYIRRATPAQLTADVYNRSAIYLCPSLSEGWHLPPAEAMACGCALVSSDIGGVADYAVDGETALLYPPGDVAAGADRLVELLRDEVMRLELSRRGGEKIAEFSWERSGDRLAMLLEEGVQAGSHL